MDKKIRSVGIGVLLVLWAVLTGLAWFAPPKAESEAERRKLEQLPELSVQTVLDGKFMAGFEDYTLDQFPLRDSFRQVKSLFHYYVLQQKDNNDIYVQDGYAAKMEYPLQPRNVAHATNRFGWVYEHLLKDADCKVYAAVVPDKSYYLAEENGYLAMDYSALFAQVREQMPWATHVDLTDCLEVTDYYRTDTHWRQEHILPVAQKLSQAMGVTLPQEQDFTKTLIQRPFYGVYYGQAALPMPPEELYVMRSALLNKCKVFDYEANGYGQVYDMRKQSSKDLYDVYLSGAKALLRIENPEATTDRELVVFRDSFGSSLVPLLVQDYKTVTLVDLRYLDKQTLDRYVTFDDQDVLFLYSTLVLNNGTSIR